MEVCLSALILVHSFVYFRTSLYNSVGAVVLRMRERPHFICKPTLLNECSNYGLIFSNFSNYKEYNHLRHILNFRKKVFWHIQTAREDTHIRYFWFCEFTEILAQNNLFQNIVNFKTKYKRKYRLRFFKKITNKNMAAFQNFFWKWTSTQQHKTVTEFVFKISWNWHSI